jgi:hypothetical protein
LAKNRDFVGRQSRTFGRHTRADVRVGRDATQQWTAIRGAHHDRRTTLATRDESGSSVDAISPARACAISVIAVTRKTTTRQQRRDVTREIVGATPLLGDSRPLHREPHTMGDEHGKAREGQHAKPR